MKSFKLYIGFHKLHLIIVSFTIYPKTICVIAVVNKLMMTLDKLMPCNKMGINLYI